MKNILIISLLSLTLCKGYGQDYHLIKDSIQSILDKKEIPGAFVTVVTKDSILFQEGFGFADIHKKESVSPKHLFRLGSVTKTFTAMAIMKLVQDGKLSLEDELKNVAPEIPFNNKWEETYPVKIKHLLTHRSGFDDIHLSRLVNISQKPTGTSTFREVLYFQDSFTCNWKPGLVFSYSNPGYSILGYLIEKLSRESYQSYLKNNILRPLGMKNSLFISEIGDETSLAVGYSSIDEKIKSIDPNQSFYGETGGGLLSNARDMGRFLQYFLSQGLQDSLNIVDKEGILEMEKLQSDFEIKNKIMSGYSLGLQDREFGNPIRNFKGHSGLIDGFVTNFIYSREHNIGIAVSSNMFARSNRVIINVLLEKFCSPPVETQKLPKSTNFDIKKFKAWEGEHRQLNEDNELYHFVNFPVRTKNLKIRNNTLYLSEFLGETEEYHHIADNAFKKPNELSPSLFLTEFENEKSIHYNGYTFARTSAIAYTFVRICLILSLTICVVLFVLLLVQIPLSLFKITSSKTLYNSFVLNSPHLLIIGSAVLFFMNYYSYDGIKNLGQFTGFSGSLFIMTMFYPLACSWVIFRSFQVWSSLKKTFSKILIGLALLSNVFMTIYCICLGWFMLRLWL